MTTHRLKTWPEPFQATLDGRKPFEVRNNDRGYVVGDVLVLQEWDPNLDCAPGPSSDPERYTGRECVRTVTYVLHGGQFGLPNELCVLGLAGDWNHNLTPEVAAHNLRWVMRDLSEKYYSAGWLDGLEESLWTAITQSVPSKQFNATEIADLKCLSEAACGWWRWDKEAGEEVFVPMETWKKITLKRKALP